MTEPIFKVKNISKSFGEHLVLSDISMEIMPGEVIGIIGASGSGKTTFLNLLIGFLKADSGTVEFRLKHLLSYKDNAIYRSVYDKPDIVKTVYGFASQVPSFYEELTIKENLKYFGSLYNLSPDAIQANSETLLALMNLQYASNIQAKNLSGGMKRRLDIACSLMHDPEVLILDEPTADLDPIHRNHIWALIKKINSKGTTIILSSHHLNEMENLCERVAIINNERIVEFDKPENLKKKYVHNEEIVFKTKNNKYDFIIKELDKKIIEKIKIQKNEAHIVSKNIEKTLKEILEAIHKNEDKLKDIRILGSSLDDVFINLINNDKKSKIKENLEK